MQTGEIIKKLRKDHGLTQEQLGEIVGVQKSAIAKYERGAVVNLKRETIQKLADYFGVRPSYIMGLTDEPLSLSDEEVRLVIAYRRADSSAQKIVGIALGLDK
jgi:transcriptional regulator with XRE-family HTH domain